MNAIAIPPIGGKHQKEEEEGRGVDGWEKETGIRNGENKKQNTTSAYGEEELNNPTRDEGNANGCGEVKHVWN